MDEGLDWTMADPSFLRVRSYDRLPPYAYGYYCRRNYSIMYVLSISGTNIDGK